MPMQPASEPSPFSFQFLPLLLVDRHDRLFVGECAWPDRVILCSWPSWQTYCIEMVEIVGGDATHLCANTGADQERYREPLRKTPRARSRAAPHTGWIDRRWQVWRDVPASGSAHAR